MAASRQLGREALIYLAGFIGAGLLQFIAIPIYSRVLGPVHYGQYSLVLATTTMLAGLMVLGGDVALARFWGSAETRQAQRRLASSWILFLTGWSVVVAAIALAVGSLLPLEEIASEGIAPVLAIGVLGMVPAQLSRMLAQILRNTFQPARFATTMVITYALDVALGLFFSVALELGVAGVFLGILVGESIGGLVRFALVRPYLSRHTDFGTILPLLRFGVPFVPVSLAVWALQSTDRLILSRWVEPERLGHYALAVSMVAIFTITAMALGQAWIPRVVQLYERDPDAARVATASAVPLSLAGYGAAAMLVGALAPTLIEFFGGPEYLPGAEALPLLALGAALAGVSQFAATGLTLMKRTGLYSLAVIAAAALCIVLQLILVPQWEMLGAAVAIATGYATLLAAVLIMTRFIYPLPLAGARLAVALVVLALQTAACTARLEAAGVGVATAGGLLVLIAVTPLPWRRSARPGRRQ